MIRRAAAAPGGAVIALLLALLGSAAWSPLPAAAADPSPVPTRVPCSALYPEEGPAGLDLRLGCAVSRLVAGYTGERVTDEPARVSAWLPGLGAVSAGVIALLLALRWAWRRANRRLAPVLPAAWWACPACHSLNAGGKAACYSCGRQAGPGDVVLPTAEHPETPQAFGGTRKSDRG